MWWCSSNAWCGMRPNCCKDIYIMQCTVYRHALIHATYLYKCNEDTRHILVQTQTRTNCSFRFIQYSSVLFFPHHFCSLRNKCFALGGFSQWKHSEYNFTEPHTHIYKCISVVLFGNAISMYNVCCTYVCCMHSLRPADVCECVIAVATMHSSGARLWQTQKKWDRIKSNEEKIMRASKR